MSAEKPFSELTLADLRLKGAQLERRAAALRAEQRASVPTSPTSLARSREIREVALQATEYRRLLDYAEGEKQ